MKFGQRIWATLETNPLTWLLLVALLVAVYGNWKLGKTLTRVCELAMDPDEVVIFHRNPKTDRDRLNKICDDRLSDPVGPDPDIGLF